MQSKNNNLNLKILNFNIRNNLFSMKILVIKINSIKIKKINVSIFEQITIIFVVFVVRIQKNIFFEK